MPAGYRMELKTIGDHLRKARMDKGLLQRDIARIIGVQTDTVTNWENNRSIPHLRYHNNIKKLIEEYRV